MRGQGHGVIPAAVLPWPQPGSQPEADHAIQRCGGRGLAAGVTRYRYHQRSGVRAVTLFGKPAGQRWPSPPFLWLPCSLLKM